MFDSFAQLFQLLNLNIHFYFLALNVLAYLPLHAFMLICLIMLIHIRIGTTGMARLIPILVGKNFVVNLHVDRILQVRGVHSLNRDLLVV